MTANSRAAASTTSATLSERCAGTETAGASGCVQRKNVKVVTRLRSEFTIRPDPMPDLYSQSCKAALVEFSATST